jgi:serine/threonine protein kinase
MGISRAYVLDCRSRVSALSTGISIKANILIDQTGNPCLSDFGCLSIISDPANVVAPGSYESGGTVRWTSPELIVPEQFGLENSRRTKSSDCYALGMVIYEVS